MMYRCLDCGREFDEEGVIYYSLDAYDDDPDGFCPYCQSDHIVELNEES